MKILIGDDVKKLTGYAQKKLQKKWFADQKITHRINSKGQVYTTDDWMNGKDKYQAEEQDGFNLGAVA
jgi:hypothetical protein